MGSKRYAIIVGLVFGLVLFKFYNLGRNFETNYVKELIKSGTTSDKITLVIVSCPPPKNNGSREEAVVLLKSIIISAKLYKIRNIEILFFFENANEETDFFMQKLQEFGYPFNDIDFKLHFQSANDAVPEKYREQFINKTDNKKLLRCTNVRIFLPRALPKVDSILYLDTDAIVHGNLADIWNMWNFMDDEQLIGISTDYEKGSDRYVWFRNAPFPPPRGLNAGISLMNLTRMRQFNWEEKLLRIWKDYYPIVPRFNDQHLVNIMLYYNTDLLFRLPCHFNYMEQHCNLKSPCKSAEVNGLVIIHGAAERFTMLGSFRNYFLAYQQLNITDLDLSSENTFRIELKKLYQYFSSKSKLDKYTYRQKYNKICHPILSKLI